MAAKITPKDPEVQYNLGAVLEACEQLEESIVAYERALKGGIERAEENLRVRFGSNCCGVCFESEDLSFTQNVRAKILAVRLGPKPKEVEEMEKKQDQQQQQQQ